MMRVAWHAVHSPHSFHCFLIDPLLIRGMLLERRTLWRRLLCRGQLRPLYALRGLGIFHSTRPGYA